MAENNALRGEISDTLYSFAIALRTNRQDLVGTMSTTRDDRRMKAMTITLGLLHAAELITEAAYVAFRDEALPGGTNSDG